MLFEFDILNRIRSEVNGTNLELPWKVSTTTRLIRQKIYANMLIKIFLRYFLSTLTVKETIIEYKIVLNSQFVHHDKVLSFKYK